MNKIASYSLLAASVLSVGIYANWASGGKASCCGMDMLAPARAELMQPSAVAAGTAQPQIDAAVKSCLAVHDLLAQDKLDGVDAELGKIREAAKGLAGADDAKIKTQGAAIAASSAFETRNIKDVREAFKKLSTEVIALVHIAPQTADAASTLFEASCPMAKASWLQTTKDVSNPYYGKQMPDCGKIERKIEPAPGKAQSPAGHQH